MNVDVCKKVNKNKPHAYKIKEMIITFNFISHIRIEIYFDM